MMAVVTFSVPAILAVMTFCLMLTDEPFPSFALTRPLTFRRALRAAVPVSLSNLFFGNKIKASPGGDLSLCGVLAALTAFAIAPKSASEAISP